MNHDQRDTRYLDTGHTLALKFAGGWWFVNIIGRETTELKPYILKNENGNRAAIAADTAGDENDRIRDPSGDELIVPDSDQRNLIFQVMYGIAPSSMQVFERFGRERNRAIEAYDQPGDPAPIVEGFDSPYNNPSHEAEMWTINDISDPKLQAYNPTDEPLEARLSLHVNKYRYATITDRSTQKAILQGNTRARLVSMGGGVQDADQLSIPNWLKETFGEHIRSSEDILTYQAGGSGASGGPSNPVSTDVTGTPQRGGR